MAPRLSAKNIIERLTFALFMRNIIPNETRQIFFSDETHLQMGQPTIHGKYHWAKTQPDPLEISVAKCEYVSFSAFVSKCHKLPLRPLHLPRRNAAGEIMKTKCGKVKMSNAMIDSLAYIELVLKPLKDDLTRLGLLANNKASCIIMQDGASSHCSRVTMEYIDANFGLENWITRAPKAYIHKVFSFWPAHTPGGNPLDFSIWNEFKRIVTQNSTNGCFSSREECIEMALAAWEQLPLSYIKKCCDEGFKNRLNRIIEAKGHTERKPKKKDGPVTPITPPNAFHFDASVQIV